VGLGGALPRRKGLPLEGIGLQPWGNETEWTVLGPGVGRTISDLVMQKGAWRHHAIMMAVALLILSCLIDAIAWQGSGRGPVCDQNFDALMTLPPSKRWIGGGRASCNQSILYLAATPTAMP
jgi:hypothetical protein